MFAVTVDRRAEGYVPDLFGRGGYAIVADPGRLARRCRPSTGSSWAERGAVDVAALATRLAEVALRHRSEGEVQGYGLASWVRFKLGQVVQRKAEEERQAAEGAEIFAFMSAGRRTEEGAPDDASPRREAGGADAGAEEQPAVEPPPPPPPPELPDLPPTDPDRDVALAALHAEIAAAFMGTAERNALRRELDARRREACETVQAAFLAELGKAADELDDDEKRRLRNAKGRASKAAKKAFLVEQEPAAIPPRDPVLFTGGQGTGKTQAAARALAALPGGDVLVLIGTIAKAEELRDEIEQHRPASMFTFVWYGRTQPVPKSKQPDDEQAGNPAFLDLNRRRSERMCSRPKGLIEDAQRAGVEMGKTFCSACPDAARLPLRQPGRHHQALRGPAPRPRATYLAPT